MWRQIGEKGTSHVHIDEIAPEEPSSAFQSSLIQSARQLRGVTIHND